MHGIRQVGMASGLVAQQPTSDRDEPNPLSGSLDLGKNGITQVNGYEQFKARTGPTMFGSGHVEPSAAGLYDRFLLSQRAVITCPAHVLQLPSPKAFLPACHMPAMTPPSPEF